MAKFKPIRVKRPDAKAPQGAVGCVIMVILAILAVMLLLYLAMRSSGSPS